MPATSVSFEEWRDCSELTYDWAESIDTKDWPRLASILAPTLRINHSVYGDYHRDALPAADFVALVSSPALFGSQDVVGQHLVGVQKFFKHSEDVIRGTWQCRGIFHRYQNEGAETRSVASSCELWGHITVDYKKTDGVWKWAGLETHARFFEGDFSKVMVGLDPKKFP